MKEPTGTSKKNCWEIKSCGRGPNRPQTERVEVCPAAEFTSADGVNGGVNGGRVCWAIAGTMCGGRVQGTFALKFGSCMKCSVFTEIKQEEGKTFLLLPIEKSTCSTE